MSKCEFYPGSGGPCCKKNTLLARIARATGLPAEGVEELVCLEGTTDERACDCTGFNDLQTFGDKSEYAALDPQRLP